MARSTPPDSTPGKRKLTSGWDKFWLFLVFVILFSVILQKCGFHVVERTEDSKIIQKPHKGSD